MKQSEMMAEIDILLEESKTAVLATVDADGKPKTRWMSPTILKDRADVLYAITASTFDKAGELKGNDSVQWMIQNPSLDTVVTVRGKVNLIDNPAIKSEVLENLGRRLTAFWKLNEKQEELLVLETIIEEAVLFKPMQGKKSKVKFQ